MVKGSEFQYFIYFELYTIFIFLCNFDAFFLLNSLWLGIYVVYQQISAIIYDLRVKFDYSKIGAGGIPSWLTAPLCSPLLFSIKEIKMCYFYTLKSTSCL